MNPPFSTLSPKRRTRWLVGALAVTLAVQAGLVWSGAPLRTDEAPWGIVSFEFAGRPEQADAMLASWRQKDAVGHAAFNLGLDYLFLPAYAVAIALACVAVAHALRARWPVYARAGAMLAWFPFGAALLDAVENAALIQVVFGARSAAWPALAWGCALVKFILVGGSLLYVLVGLGARWLRR